MTEATPKYVVEYQATDEEGNPIGVLTRLTAETPEEMFEKQKQSHINATRALQRQNKAYTELKARKVAKIEPVKPARTPEEERQLAAGVVNPDKAKDSIRKLGGIEDVEDRLQKMEAAQKNAEGRATAYQFMQRHLTDFFPCEANSKAMNDFLNDNNLEYTLDNLEIAFATIGSNLAKRPAVNNPTIEPQAQPSEHKETRQPSFGVQPGTGSGSRPVVSSTGKMSKKDIIVKKKADPAWWKQVLHDPAKLAEVNAILARG